MESKERDGGYKEGLRAALAFSFRRVAHQLSRALPFSLFFFSHNHNSSTWSLWILLILSSFVFALFIFSRCSVHTHVRLPRSAPALSRTGCTATDGDRSRRRQAEKQYLCSSLSLMSTLCHCFARADGAIFRRHAAKDNCERG